MYFRNKRKIKYDNRFWTIHSLDPFDFLECSYWPFAYYHLPKNQTNKTQEVKRDWKLKPANKIDEEKKLENSIRHALILGAEIKLGGEYDEIKKDEKLHSILLAEIYALTYQLTPIEKLFASQKEISRDFAESLAIKSKVLHVEPYSLIADVSREKPELYNPKRYDFNWFILGVGWDRERREFEKLKVKGKR